MITAQRFLFETSFDPEDEHLRAVVEAEPEPEPEPEPPPPPTFSEAELAAARAEARAAGIEEGRREAMESIERQTATTLQAVGGQIMALLESQKEADAALAGQIAELTLTMMRKMVPALMSRAAGGEIEAVIRRCLADLMEEPRVVVRVADALLESVKARVDRIVADTHFQGAVVLIAEPGLKPGDVRVEWADGGAERLSANVWAEIVAAVARLRAPATGEAQPARIPGPQARETSPQEAVRPPAKADSAPAETTPPRADRAAAATLKTIAR